MHVLSRLSDQVVKTPKKFSAELYKQRYSALYPKDGLFMQRNKFVCLRDDPDRHSELLNKCVVVAFSSQSCR